MNNNQQCWWEQAQSDHAVLVVLRGKGVAPCHQLHYLQMVTEKLAKAYFWRSGDAPKKSHIGFAPFMRALQHVPKVDRQRIADIFAFQRFEGFRSFARNAMPLVYDLERLAPALSNNGPNPEYPWPRGCPFCKTDAGADSRIW
jgi:hypothetical protein